jgi:elongation factor Tu
LEKEAGHFIAEIHLLTTKEGGRRTPFRVNFRPQLYVDDPSNSTSCFIHKIHDRDEVAPGETVTVEASLLNPEIVGELSPGQRFQMREGGRTIGWGTVQRSI